MDITDKNNLIYAAATIMTQTFNEPNKKRKKQKQCKVLQNKNTEADTQLEKRIINNGRNWNRLQYWKNLTVKRGIFFKNIV
jgi:hypothetical protein